MTVGKRPAPRLWVMLLTLAGAGVVVLSWMAPEPLPRPAAHDAGYQHTSYSQCAADAAPPNYGTRSVSDVQCVR